VYDQSKKQDGYVSLEVSPHLARELVKVYLSAHFTNEERHRRRLEKTRALEKRY
jgi:ribose 5-phosphate isomerase RpiB